MRLCSRALGVHFRPEAALGNMAVVPKAVIRAGEKQRPLSKAQLIPRHVMDGLMPKRPLFLTKAVLR